MNPRSPESATALVDAPEIINSDPYGEGWILKFSADDETEFEALMTPTDYEIFIQEEE